MYRRNRRNGTISPELMSSIHQANQIMKRDHSKIMQGLTKRQNAAIQEYSLHLE